MTTAVWGTPLPGIIEDVTDNSFNDDVRRRNAEREARKAAILQERRAMGLVKMGGPYGNIPINPDPSRFELQKVELSAAAKAARIPGGYVLVHRDSGRMVVHPAELAPPQPIRKAHPPSLAAATSSSSSSSSSSLYPPPSRLVSTAGFPPTALTNATRILHGSPSMYLATHAPQDMTTTSSAANQPLSTWRPAQDNARVTGKALAEHQVDDPPETWSLSSLSSELDETKPWWKVIVQRGLTLHTFYVGIVILLILLAVLVMLLIKR